MQSISSLASGVSKAVWGDSTTQQQSGEELKSGETGEGTSTQPFDAGNAPEQDQVNKTTTTESSKPQNARAPSFTSGSKASTGAEDQVTAAGNPLQEPPSTSAVKDDTNPNTVQKTITKDTNNPFDAKAPGASANAPLPVPSKTRADSPERSVSPGARPDGSHAETGKPEKTKFSTKLKSKLHIGSSSGNGGSKH